VVRRWIPGAVVRRWIPGAVVRRWIPGKMQHPVQEGRCRTWEWRIFCLKCAHNILKIESMYKVCSFLWTQVNLTLLISVQRTSFISVRHCHITAVIVHSNGNLKHVCCSARVTAEKSHKGVACCWVLNWEFEFGIVYAALPFRPWCGSNITSREDILKCEDSFALESLSMWCHSTRALGLPGSVAGAPISCLSCCSVSARAAKRIRRCNTQHLEGPYGRRASKSLTVTEFVLDVGIDSGVPITFTTEQVFWNGKAFNSNGGGTGIEFPLGQRLCLLVFASF
jgi:hypothetical protein